MTSFDSLAVPFHKHSLGKLLNGFLLIFTIFVLFLVDGFGLQILPVVLLGGTVVWAVFYNPFIGILFVFLMIFSGAAAGFEIPGGYFAVAALVSLAWLTDKLWKLDLSFNISRRQSFFIALFLSSLLLSVPFSLNRETSMLTMIGYVKVIVLYVLTVNLINSKKRFNTAIAIVLFTLVISFIYGIYSLLWGLAELSSVQVSEEAIQRIQGLTFDPNLYASSLLIFIPMPFLLFFNENNNWKRAFYLALFVTLVSAVITTFSRGGIISLALLMMFLTYKQRNHRGVFIGSLVLLVVILFLMPADFWERFNFITNLRSEGSARWRLKHAIHAFNYFIDNPFFGIGLGNYIRESIRVIPIHQHVHNMYLEVAAETGIFGLVSFLGLLWVTIQYHTQSQKLFQQNGDSRFALYAETLRIGFYGFLLSSLFLSLQMDTLLWAQIGIAGALRIIAEKSIALKPEGI